MTRIIGIPLVRVGPVRERTKLARWVSPLTYVSRHCPPMFLIHGTADAIVPVEETLAFHDALTQAGASSMLRIIEGGPHDAFLEQTADDVRSFFMTHLRRPGSPSIPPAPLIKRGG